MSGVLKLFVWSLAVFAATAAIDYFVMPPTVPVALAQDPQPLWQVELAFLLRAIENVSAAVAAVIVLLAAAFYVRRRLRPGAPF